MLHLASDTDPSWVTRAEQALPDLLLDHCHCEKKAASTAMSLLFKYQDHPQMMVPLSEVAREELEHFELMLGLLADRGIAFERQKPSPYAGRIKTACRREEPHALLDTLLMCALIEARSCERMRLLSEHLSDPKLRTFYGDLLESEARHHMLYVRMACAFEAKDVVYARLAELAAHEAAVIASAPSDIRMHN